ncbi:MAG: aminoglycoside phosphotransferase family protein [Myxococcota bacterium]|nr:aminoglycoside phosphotransferase family protein [Myxococcota bacterium]
MSRPPLQAWSELCSLPHQPLDGGLINETYAVGTPPVAVVQKLHPVFPGRVNEDIAAVTAHLAAKGMCTPRVIPAADGRLWVETEQGPWRALTWVPGRSVHKVSDPALAAAAGALVARWHHAVSDLEHEFVFSRPLAHHTPHHMELLQQALDAHKDHRLHDQVAPLAQEVLGLWERWQGELDEPTAVAHGDLKISNLRFDEAGQGICLLDLDTMGRLPLSVELGDAWRSWCNPAAEDAAETRFDLELFEASARGYLAERPLESWQRVLLPFGVERICLELSARFLCDALEERYFGWNPKVAPTRGAHNLLRGQGQLALARSVHSQLGAMHQILR